jgi:ribosomal protein S12 methylthiotransferase accessory factor
MHEHYQLVGKDARLDASIAKMQQGLQAIGFHIEERSWLNPIEGVWSVHIRDQDCPLLFTNGKGRSKLAALASALGEFFERLSCNYFFADYYLGKTVANAPFVHYPQERWFTFDEQTTLADLVEQGLLDFDLLALYDVEQDSLPQQWLDTNSGALARGICALPFVRQDKQATVYFPVNIIGNLYVSNGMSAGNSPMEARVQALSEIFERWVKFKIIAEGMCLPDIPNDVLQRYPTIVAGIEALRAAGYGIVVKDASLGGRYPVISVTLLNLQDQGCYASFGAHPRFEVALERALTELLQGRGLDALGGFSEPSFDQGLVASSHNLETHFIDSSGHLSWQFFAEQTDIEFVDWDFRGTTSEEFQHLCDILHQEDKAVYIADYTHLTMYSCRILVPDLSEIYPFDDLQWDNNNAGLAYRDALLHLPDLAQSDYEDLLANLQDEGFDDGQPVAALIGLAADANSAWVTLRIGELKTLLALACHDQVAILEGCDWLAHFGQLQPSQAKLYRCILQLVQMDDVTHYHTNLMTLFGENTVNQAKQMLAGDGLWQQLPTLGDDLQGSQAHQGLLHAYEKLQQQKRQTKNDK